VSPHKASAHFKRRCPARPCVLCCKSSDPKSSSLCQMILYAMAMPRCRSTSGDQKDKAHSALLSLRRSSPPSAVSCAPSLARTCLFSWIGRSPIAAHLKVIRPRRMFSHDRLDSLRVRSRRGDRSRFQESLGLASSFRFKRPYRCPVRTLWVYHLRFYSHLISNGKSEAMYGDE